MAIFQNGSNTHQIAPIVDTSFQQIAKNKPAFFIWRVENMQLCPVPKDSYGLFFKGDTYLIFSATETPSRSIVQHIHLWIGEESTNVIFGILFL
jgi:gelsolin